MKGGGDAGTDPPPSAEYAVLVLQRDIGCVRPARSFLHTEVHDTHPRVTASDSPLPDIEHPVGSSLCGGPAPPP
jgi:hypothetical protein